MASQAPAAVVSQAPGSPLFCINMNGTLIHTAINPNVLAQFWASLSVQLIPGGSVIGIAGPTFRILDEGGRYYVAQNFAIAVGDMMVKYVVDGSGMHPDRYFLGRESFFHAENLHSQPGDLDIWVPPGYPLDPAAFALNGQVGVQLPSDNTQRTARAKIPRPPNAYILYRKDHHKAVKQSNTKLSNNEISIILGRQWNEEKDDVRMYYHMMAVEIKRQVERLHPDYKYNPRKSSEIRRRAHANNGNAQAEAENDAATNQDEESEVESILNTPFDFNMSPDTSESVEDGM